ncbi:MAG: NAD(P)-dependent alcohol dehydrogenase [Myxococcota bacterium]
MSSAWQISSFGMEHLQRVELPDPDLGPEQVKVRVKACSINYRDALMVKGLYNPKQPLPLVPLSDGAGEVVAVGERVTEWKVGDRVAATFFQDWQGWPVPSRDRIRQTRGGPLPGMLQETTVLHPHELVRLPEHLSFVEGATLPCAALTAWSALVAQGSLSSSDTVLIQGTGGVALFALQFAVMQGARVILLSSSDERLRQAEELGAWAGINYTKQPEWFREVLALTNKQGVTHVVELGGANTLNQSVRCIRPGGFIAMIGVLGGAELPFNVLPVVMQNVRLQGVLVGNRQDFLRMNEAIEHHQLRPVVSHRFPFAEAPRAMEALSQGGAFGKVVIDFEEDVT